MGKNSMEQDRIIELYRGELWECQLLESILRSESVDCFLKNNIGNGYNPIIISAQQVQIMIKQSDLAKGLRIVEDFKRNNQK